MIKVNGITKSFHNTKAIDMDYKKVQTVLICTFLIKHVLNILLYVHVGHSRVLQ